VCVFQRQQSSKASRESALEIESEDDVVGKRRQTFAENEGIKFDGFVEFQSHHPGFDYLKSLEIEEKINQIKWCNRTCNSLLLLSTNDKTIKLWKLSMRNQLKLVHSMTAAPKTTRKKIVTSRDLSITKLIRSEKKVVIPKEARTYADAHTYHINSVSVSSDGINFLSADDLRVYLWDINRSYKYVPLMKV